MTNRQPRSQAIRHRARALWLLLVLPFSSLAGTAEGLGWLATQQNANGSFGSTPTTLASPVQTTSEVLRAWRSFGQQAQPASAAALGFINADPEVNTEFLTRKIIVNAAAGVAVTPFITTLLTHQNYDGGFSDKVGHASNAYDTALALEALMAANYADANVIGSAVYFLTQQQRADGGFGLGPSNDSSVLATSLALTALQRVVLLYNVSAPIDRAAQYLLQRQATGGGWGQDFETAAALIALVPVVSDTSRYSASLDALKARQLASGSWVDDAYTTALALRALYLAANVKPPVTPTMGSFTGRIVNDATGVPLAGVTVSVDQIAGKQTVTTADGSFALTELAPGQYSLRYQLAGFNGATQAVSAQVGVVTNIGTVRLAPLPDQGVIVGVVFNAATAQPIAGALIAVTGATSASVTTDATGAFRIVSPPGTVTVTASAAGFDAASGTGTVVAGGTLNFSPGLYTTGSTPTDPSVQVKGVVVDAESGVPLAGASVAVTGGSAQSDNAGAFLITGLTAVQLAIEISRTGYQTVGYSAAAPAGSVIDLGQVRLPRAVAATSTTVIGKVLDAVSGAPIAGASVSVQGGGGTISAADGSYRIEGITATQFTLSASAVGYLSKSGSVTIASFGTANVDITLERGAASDFAITGLTANAASYPALTKAALTATLANSSTTDRAVRLFVKVVNGANEIVEEYPAVRVPLGGDPSTALVSVTANGQKDFSLDWQTGRHAPGVYQVIVQAIDGNSGVLLAERGVSLQVEATNRIGGSVEFDPPIAQLAARKPVAITAAISNRGNQVIGPTTATARVYLKNLGYQERRDLTSGELLVTGQGLNSPQGADVDGAGNVYVANQSANNVLKITPAGAVSVFATGFTSPVDVSLDGAGNVYVLNANFSFVRIGAGGTRTQVTTNLSGQRAIKALNDGRVYIVRGNALHEVSADGATVRQIVAGGLANPQGLVIASSGDVFIASRGDNAISRYSLATGTLSTFVTGINQPYGMAIDGADNLYVTAFGSNSLVQVTPAGVVTTIATGLAGPYDVKIAPDGNFVVSNYNSNQIVRVTPTGQVSVLVEGALNRPNAVAYDGSGNAYVGNEVASNVVRLGTDGSTTTVATGVSPSALHMASDGNLYVLEGHQLNRVAPDGTRMVIATGLSGAFALAPAPDGNGLVLSEPGQNRIRRVDAGGALSVYSDASFTTVRSMRTDAAGNIYILTSSHITRVTPAGQVSRFVSGLNNAYDMVFDATGNLIVTEYSLRRLLSIDPNGNVSVLATLTFNPAAIARAVNGNLLVGTWGGTTVYTVDSTGAVSTFATFTRAVYYGLLADPLGNVWVAHYYNQAVTRVAPDNSQTTYTVGSFPAAFVADGQGGVYVGAYNTVNHISAAGAVSVFATGGPLAFQYQQGIALDNTGRLWAIDNYGTINRFNPDRTHDRQFASLSQPGGLATGAAGELYIASRGNRRILKLAAPGALPEVVAAGADIYLVRESNDTILAASTAGVRRLNVVTGQFSSLAAGFGYLTGIAVSSSGTIGVVDNSRNELVTLSGTGAVVDRFAGLVQPKGLVFDGAGRLLVANNYPNQILRVRPDGRLEAFANVSGVNYMYRETDGRITASRSSDIVVLSAAGAQLSVFNSLSAYGLARAGDGSLYVASNNDGALLRHAADGSYIKAASGLASARDLELRGGGEVLVADSTRGVVVRVNADATLSLVASNLAQAERLAFEGAGNLYVAYSSNRLAVFDAAGARSELATSDLVASAFTGLAARGTTVYTIVGGANTIAKFTTQAAAPPIQPGTTVYTTSVGISGLDLSGQASIVNFGAWVPAASGDYAVEVVLDGNVAQGTLSNTLHVGPNATGTIDVAQRQVPPGTRPVTGILRVQGADSTAVTRIDPSGARLAAVSNTYGRAIAGDSQGNIYSADPNRIVKITPAGVVSNFVTGITVGNGLAVDSQDNIYAVSGSNVLKIAPNATVSTLANLGATAYAVAVGYDDQVYAVDGANRLSRVDATTGAVTVLTTLGLSGPQGLTIDAFGNFYVLNRGDKITRITPNLKSALYFDKATFEYEGVNVTADCSNNLLFAPIVLPPFKPYGEEDRIIQLVGDTGETRQVLYGPSIDPAMSDMDVLFYDRLGKRLLIWTDLAGGKIFSFPVICGGIDTEVHIVTSATVDLSSADPAPTSVTPLSDGTAEWTWLLSEVDNRGRSIQLNLLLKNLQEGESRPIAREAFLVFKNSFVAGESVRVPIDIPAVLAGSAIGLQAALDNTQYGPNSLVGITVDVSNGSPLAFDGTLELSIKDTASATVATLAPIAVSGLAGLSVQPYNSSWNTGQTLSGDYRVAVTLKNDLGQVAASADVPFRIVSDAGGAAAVTLRTTTDRAVYHTTDQVLIQNLIRNVTANGIVENAVLRLVVLDPAGQTRYAQDIALGQLLPGSIRDRVQPFGLNGAPVGLYQVQGTVIDSATQGMLATAAFRFEVRVDLAKSLGGSVSLAASSVEVGHSQTCTNTVTNEGSTAVLGLEVHHLLLSLDSGQLVNEAVQTLDLAAGAAVAYNFGFSTQGFTLGNYSCAVQARVDGELKTLAFASFKVTQSPVKIAASLSRGTKGRLLVLLDNGRRGDDQADHKYCGGVRSLELTATLAAPLSTAATVEVRAYGKDGNLIDTESAALAYYGGVVNFNAGAGGADLAIKNFAAQSVVLGLEAPAGADKLGEEYSVELLVRDGNTQRLVSGAVVTDCRKPIAVGQVYGAVALTALDATPAANDGPYQDGDPHGPTAAPGLAAQRAFLEALLKAAGYSYTITDTAEAFTRELRSGGYASYALFTEQEKLSEQAQKELREAVYRGAGLLVAGAHDDRHQKLNDALGVKLIGRLSSATGVDLNAGIGVSGRLDLIAGDKALRIKRRSAQSLGTYVLSGTPGYSDDHDCQEEGSSLDNKRDGRSSSAPDECEGHPERYLDAIIANSYGRGQAAFAAFDLLATAARDGQGSLSARTLQRLLERVQPLELATTVGAVLPIELTLANQGVATAAVATVVLPPSVKLIDAGGGQVTANSLVFTTNLGVGRTARFVFYMKLPGVAATTSVNAVVTAPGVSQPVAYAVLDVTAVQPEGLTSIKTRIAGLIDSKHPATKALKETDSYIDKALDNFYPAKAIEYLLKAADQLLGIDDPAVRDIRVAIDVWIGWASGYAY